MKYVLLWVSAWCGLLIASCFGSVSTSQAAVSPVFGNCQFRQAWEYSDKPVADGVETGRGLAWGLRSFGQFEEIYEDAPGSKREVQYFDKGRMEWSAGSATMSAGLLTKELVTGLRQEGEAAFRPALPSFSPIAGDDNKANPAPGYAAFRRVISLAPGENTAGKAVGQIVKQAINRTGEVNTLAKPPAQLKIGSYEPTLGHNIPQVFLSYQNLTGQVWYGSALANGKVYADNPTGNLFGLPLTEPYWIKARIGEAEKDVLVQLFERRVLTYTPSNPAAFRVEMGNVGQHYHQWRYNGVVGSLTDGCLPAPAAPASVGRNIDCAVQKCIALTFDDGPSQYTSQVLDALKARGVVATFFVEGRYIKPFAEVVKRAVNEGNEIGNHTWNHPELTKLAPTAIRQQIQQTQEEIRQVVGFYPRLMRPPYGLTNSLVAANVGLPQIKWSRDTLDWLYQNPQVISSRALYAPAPGMIILFHDVYPTTAAAVPGIVDKLIAQGYTLVTVSELLDLNKNPAKAPPGKLIFKR